MTVAHIIGLGRSGIASARLLARDGWDVTLSDAGQSLALQTRKQSLEEEGIHVLLDTRFSLSQLEALECDRPKLIVVSPGVRWDLPALLEARSQGIETIGEVELAWRHLKNIPWIGITGTNGKTTTTAMIAAILQAAGLKAPACGNNGYSVSELALASQPLDWVVAEISSYQIESSATLAPKIGVWTTLTPDHLERHGTMASYQAIKAALIKQSKLKILNGDDPILRNGLARYWPDAWWTQTQIPTQEETPASITANVYIKDGWATVEGTPIVEINRLKMLGNHNQQNVLLAIAATHLAGVDKDAIASGIANFPGVEHRLEYVGTHQGVDLINDSKATNYDAAQTGLAAVKAPAILIAGGDPKVGDDTAWIKTIQVKAAYVLLIGNAGPAFAERLKENGFSQYEVLTDMDQAIPRATELAAQLQTKTILLSPACASFDQYRNFEERGDHFKQLCQGFLD